MDFAYAIEIDRSPEAVWPWIEEPERQKQWMQGLIRNELTHGRRGEIGTRFTMTIREGRRLTEMDGELEHCDEPNALRVRIWGGSMKLAKDEGMVVTYELAPTDSGGTQLTYRCDCLCRRTSFRVLGFLFGWVARIQIRGFFKSLKRLAEAEAPAAPTP